MSFQSYFPEPFLQMLKDQKIVYVTFHFTDLGGKEETVTFTTSSLSLSLLDQGIAFPQSQLSLRPDLSTGTLDPFAVQTTLKVICDGRPRQMASRAITLLKDQGYHLDLTFSLQFRVFHKKHINVSAYESMYSLEPFESCEDTDSLKDMRSEMVTFLIQGGFSVTSHSYDGSDKIHQVNFSSVSLITAGDTLNMAKYIIKNVALSYGKTATFMPFPLKGKKPSCVSLIHHFKLPQAGSPETSQQYQAGVLVHLKALYALTHPTFNSYKQADCLIPDITQPLMFPHACTNPYLSFTALALAGLDGIHHKLNLAYMKEKIPETLTESLEALNQDRLFLTSSGIFQNEDIDEFLHLKKEEIELFQKNLHPLEFKLYYNI